MLLKSRFFDVLFILALVLSFSACNYLPKKRNIIAAKQNVLDTGIRFIVIQKDTITPRKTDSLKSDSVKLTLVKDTLIKKDTIITKPVIKPSSNAQKLVDFAKALVGKPYLYGSKDPAKGFDNSGFVNYVFNNFKIEVPRYTAGFIITGNQINITEASEGDLILFSKTDSVKKAVNHIGIIISGKGNPISFIHATSGKVNGVTITNMNSYYQKRLIAVRRVL